MKDVIYVRVSTEERNNRQSSDVKTQKESMEKYWKNYCRNSKKKGN